MTELQASKNRKWIPTTAVVALLLVSAIAGVALGSSGDASTSPDEIPRRIDDLDAYHAERYPARVRVENGSGLEGWADRDKVLSRPQTVADPEKMRAGFEAWLAELVPVTQTQDPESQLVGYWAMNYGLIDLETVRAPGFDLRELQRQEEARRQQALTGGD